MSFHAQWITRQILRAIHTRMLRSVKMKRLPVCHRSTCAYRLIVDAYDIGGMSAVEGEVATPKDPPTDVAATENEVIGLDDDWSSWARNSSRKKKSKKGVVWNEEIPRSSSPPTEVATEAD